MPLVGPVSGSWRRRTPLRFLTKGAHNHWTGKPPSAPHQPGRPFEEKFEPSFKGPTTKQPRTSFRMQFSDPPLWLTCPKTPTVYSVPLFFYLQISGVLTKWRGFPTPRTGGFFMFAPDVKMLLRHKAHSRRKMVPLNPVPPRSPAEPA